MDRGSGSDGRRRAAPKGRHAHPEIDRLLAGIRRLVQRRERLRLEGAAEAEMAASNAEIRRLQDGLADAVRRQLASGDERRARRRADR